jgi:dCMP deaminase
MRIAYAVALRGTCPRKQVGCVVVDDADRSIIGTGYNGSPRGLPHCTEVGCDLEDVAGRPSCVRTLHAESNALDRIVARAPSMTLYSTVVPCHRCALRVVQIGGIGRVVYCDGYRSQSTGKTFGLFREAGVSLVRLDVPLDAVVGTWMDPPEGRCYLIPDRDPVLPEHPIVANDVAIDPKDRIARDRETIRVAREILGNQTQDAAIEPGDQIVAQDAVFGDGDGWG